MSISVLLIPLAIGFGLIDTIGSIGENFKKSKNLNESKNLNHDTHTLRGVNTIFSDAALLEKTLAEHGLTVTVHSDNRLTCQQGQIHLEYVRQHAGETFVVNISGIDNVEEFIREMECFEKEYQENVQSYTYEKLVDKLSEKEMRIADETVMEDNSILLTIDL